jgi:glyoxylase-like metal-dependent hydrolase (beta-lactamase superfamily II)
MRGFPRLIPADNPGPHTGEGNNTWLLDGAEPTLVDAGVGKPSHLEAIAEQLDGRPLCRVLITHDHPDHASGVEALRDCWPEIEVLAVATSRQPSRTLIDGGHVRAGDRLLRVLYTPGHAIDHACFWDAEACELYGGDMVQRDSSVLIPGERGGGLRAYLASLDRLLQLGAVRLYPGHGPIIEDPASAITQAIAHRAARESQIRALLESGVQTPSDIVARLYIGLPDALRDAARLTVEAHLGKIRFDDGQPRG